MSRTLPWLMIGAGAVFWMSGCEYTDSSEAIHPSFSRIDSAGIAILSTLGEDALRPLDWIVDSVPDFVIGRGDSPGEYLFRVQGMRGLPNGGFLVVDGGSRELRFFDAEGRLTHWVGRKGAGPGEFEDPLLVPLVGSDSLLVWDRYLRRFQYFSEDGRSNRTLNLKERWPGGGSPPHGAVGNMMLGVESESDWLVPASQQTQGPKDTRVHLLWYDPLSMSRIPIGFRDVTRSFILISPGRPPRHDLIPFTVVPDAAVSARGGLITYGVDFEIREYGFEGELRRILRLDLPGRPITDSMREAWIDAELSSRSGGALLEELLRAMPIPDTLPAFQSLLTDEAGCIWAQVYNWNPLEPTRWVVFNEEGAALGSVETPPGYRVEWVGSDAILGVWRDELDVEYVHRYRLTRE